MSNMIRSKLLALRMRFRYPWLGTINSPMHCYCIAIGLPRGLWLSAGAGGGRPNRNGPPPPLPRGMGLSAGLAGGRPNRSGSPQLPCGLGPSAGPGGGVARTAMGQRRQRGAWGCPRGLGGGHGMLEEEEEEEEGYIRIYIYICTCFY